MHKTANVLDKLPSSVQGKAKKDLHAIDQAAEMTTALQGRIAGKGPLLHADAGSRFHAD